MIQIHQMSCHISLRRQRSDSTPTVMSSHDLNCMFLSIHSLNQINHLLPVQRSVNKVRCQPNVPIPTHCKRRQMGRCIPIIPQRNKRKDRENESVNRVDACFLIAAFHFFTMLDVIEGSSPQLKFLQELHTSSVS